MGLANDDRLLYEEISAMIEENRRKIYAHASSSTVLLFWHIGQRINNDVLENKRADYGKKIVSALATQLTEKYGRSFALRNLRRMMQFAEQFSDFEIVSMASTQLSWSHFIEILPLKTFDAKLYYLNESNRELLNVMQLREMINRKAYERKEIANTRITETKRLPLNVFKDPYLFDLLGLKDECLETDLEEAILRELEIFIMEFGKGFAFVERQKRMIIDGEDFKLDLLFFNRNLKRLVAIELKQGKFKAEYNGQMKLYLKWLNRYERREDENEPIGLILCAGGNNREQIELLEMDKDGIMVAEYWTNLPPKAEFEQKIQSILAETREHMKRRNLPLPDEAGE
ncbi:MAG: PDDEXK nuclease domain-containing protein [Methanosarcinales archaeon]|jgi:predicted nuclease of restriction endonuclease-like (RecB) superfamily|nr:PDDEXK nuclease domain-containing protein [Methanosarcinales archaeon]